MEKITYVLLPDYLIDGNISNRAARRRAHKLLTGQVLEINPLPEVKLATIVQALMGLRKARRGYPLPSINSIHGKVLSKIGLVK